MYYTIWMHNPNERQTNVQRVYKTEVTKKVDGDNGKFEKLGVTNPWNCQQRILQNAEIGSLIGSVESPIDWWRFSKGHRKPIAEVNYTATHDPKKSGSNEWLNSRVRVETTVDIYEGSTESRSFDIPIRVFKPTGTKFFEEQTIDLGIITSPDVAHRYIFRIGNKHSKPAVVQSVAISKNCKGMNIKFATPFAYKVPLPSEAEPFDFIWLFSHPDRKSSAGYCSGTIQIKIDVSGRLETYEVMYLAGYYKHMLATEDATGFQLSKRTREGSKIINKFNATWKSSFPVDLIIQDVVFSRQAGTNYTSNVKNLRIAPGSEVPIAFVAKVVHEEADFLNKYSNSNEFVLVQTLGTQVSLLLRYYSLGLMCGLHNAITLNYEKCKPVEGIAFGYVAVGQRKVITMDIWNPTMVNYIIKRVEFKEKNSDVEIVFENQSKTGMKSYYKKANRNLNTFFLVPKNEVVSIRIKVKPKYTGNFRDSVTIYFGKGEITLQVSYSGISGGLEFSPSPIKFDLFYPIESDKQQVSVINNFNANIEITSAYSPQSFIYTTVQGSVADAKSKTPFMEMTLDLSSHRQMDPVRPNYLKSLHTESLPALSDLITHQEQAARWERIVKDGQSEISGEIVVQTELMTDLKIPVKATLHKASLVPNDLLSLGPIEEQRLHTINVSLSNPTDHNVTMRFFLADEQMLDADALRDRVEKRLKKRYAKFKDEIVCVMQRHLSEDDIRYFVDAIFGGVKHVPRLKSASQNHHCFTLNNSKPYTKKFFQSKGNYLFDMRNISRFSRKRLMKDNDDIYYLKDVIRLSKRSPPTNPRSLFGLGFIEKLSVLYARLVNQLGHKLNNKKTHRTKEKSYYLSSMKEADFQKLLKNQEIFLNPKFRYRNITLAPHQQISLPILVCRPKEFSEIDKTKMSLLIKNTYSNLAIVPIQVSLGKIGLIVDKVITVSDDNRVIYPQSPEEHYQLVFNIHPNDIVQKLSNKNDTRRIVYKKSTRRLYELKNVGNLPIKVKEVIAGEGCNFSGFMITNCQGFELAPNHTHRLEIVLARPNNFEVDFRKQVKLILEGRVLTLEFRVQANPLATSDPGSGGFTLVELATKSFTETASSAYRYIAAIFCVILIVLALKHYQEVTELQPHIIVTSLDHSRYRSEYFHDNILDINYLETTLKYKTLEAQKNKHIRNIGLKQLMTPSQQEIPSRDASVHSENQEPEVVAPKRGKNQPNVQLIKVVNNPVNPKGLVLMAPEPKPDLRKGRGEQRTQTPRAVEEPRTLVPPVDIEAVHQQPVPAKQGKKKKPKRSEHLISELTSPRVDENLTQNILAQLDPPEAKLPLVADPAEMPQNSKNRRKSTHEKVTVPIEHEEPVMSTDLQSGPSEPVVVEDQVDPPEEIAPEDPHGYADPQNESGQPIEDDQGVVEPPKIERYELKIRSRKQSAAQRQSGNNPSNRGDVQGGKMDHSQASQATSGRGGKKTTTPQNRNKHQKNPKHSPSDDEESEETFVPKHQVQPQPVGRDSKNRYQTRAGDHRDSSQDSEPEYQVKNPQLSPRQASSGPIEDKTAPKGSKESSLNPAREDPSVQAPRSRAGADNKTKNRTEKDISPRKTKDKKKTEMVYYQRVDKPNKTEQDQLSSDATPLTSHPERFTQQVAAEEASEDPVQEIYQEDKPHYSPKTQRKVEETGPEPKESLRKADASFLEEEGTQGQHFNQHMISFNNQDISAIDNLEDGASNTSQVFAMRDDLPSRDKLASRLNQKRPSNPRPDEDSDEEVGFVNRSRENIRKHMELDKNDRSHVDDSSIQEDDPINKRVGAIGGKKTKPSAPRDKPKQVIGSGAHKNASLAGFRQAENNYQPFGGMSSIFNGPRPMGANSYAYGRYDTSYGQAVYDPYGAPPGYGQPGFRGGFAPPYYPQEPQNYYQTQASQVPAYPKASVRPGVKYYNHGFGAVLMRDSAHQDPAPARAGFGQGNYRYDQQQKSPPGHSAPYDLDEDNEEQERDPAYPYIPEDEEQYEQYTGYPPGVGLDDSFAGQKQFKPALNNPFTLSGLGNSQVVQQTGPPAGGYIGYPMDYDWNKAEMYGLSKGNDGSHHSQSMSSSSRNASQLRPPPGLMNDDDNEVRERQTEELQEAKRDVHSNNETGRGLANSSIQQAGSTNKKRGNAKQQFNLFG